MKKPISKPPADGSPPSSNAVSLAMARAAARVAAKYGDDDLASEAETMQAKASAKMAKTRVASDPTPDA